MSMKRIISTDLLREVLDYDPETGVLTWKPRGLHLFKSERDMKIWNTRFAGKKAMSQTDRGYQIGILFYKNVYAHRIIWQLVHDEVPELIDHINRNKGDNRLVNLRVSNKRDNMLNSERCDRAAMKRAA